MNEPKLKSNSVAETREEDTPSAGWTFAEGGGYGIDPDVALPEPREEDSVQGAATSPIWVPPFKSAMLS